MATARKRRLTEQEGGETMNNSESDVSSEDELLMAFDCISIDSDDEDLPAERQWHYGAFTPSIPQFVGEQGLQNTISLVKRTPLDYFQLFFDETIMQHIVDETNRYYLQNPMDERQHMSNWQNVISVEMYTFLAITMLTGLIDENRIRDYWNTDPLLSTPIFGQYFTRNRYQDNLHYMHFANNKDISGNDRLEKIKSIMCDFKQKFANCVNPTQNLCIDESLMLWRGRLGFKQYIPSKRHRFGIKLFQLVDSETKFVLDFIVYTGSTTEYKVTSGLGLSGSIVMELMQRYLNKGHHLYVDNWYTTSPALFELLHRNKTGACGTVRKNRQGLPPLTTKLKRGESQYSHTNILLALKWQDKREVHMLSTIHSTAYANSNKIDRQTGEEIRKPVCILDYTKNMGAVDHVDMQVSFSGCIRKSVKWYKKLFYHLSDMAVYNAFVIYKMQNNNSSHLSDFRLEIIRGILTKYGSQRPTTIGRPSTRDSPLRLTARHFPAVIPQTSQSNQPRRKCVVCASHNIRSATRYICPDCDVPLCIVDCFKDYHTKINY